MKRTRLLFSALLLFLVALLKPAKGQLTITDNFNSGNDSTWSHYAPLQTTPWDPGAANEQASWTFPADGTGGFSYRIFGGVPKIPYDPTTGQNGGPARVGSFRNDSIYSDFLTAADLVTWNAAVPENLGFIAVHINNPGFLTTSGYLMGFSHAWNDQQESFGIIEFQTELTVSGPNQFTGGSAQLGKLDPAKRYRMVTSSSNNNLAGAIYAATDLLEPIVKIAATNSDVPTGVSGLGCVNYNLDDDKIADVTFDNYYSSPRPGDAAGFPGTAQVVNLVPAPQTLFYRPPNNGSNITFTITTFTANQINTNALSMTLNNQPVTSQLALTEVRDPLVGTHNTNFLVKYTGTLASNTVYNGQIIVVDTSGKGTTNSFVFDTFVTNGVLIVEAEDYNFNYGQFLDNPPVSGTQPDGTVINAGIGYYLSSGVSNVDYFNTDRPAGATNDQHAYRLDGVSTAQNLYAGDTPRADHVVTNVPDYYPWRMQAGDWMNYTRTFPAGNWNVYLRASSQAAEAVRFDQVTTDPSQDDSSQTKVLLGNFLVPNTGSSTRFRYVPLSDAAGNPMVLSFNSTSSSPTNTFRIKALGGFDSRRVHGGDDSGSLQPTYFLFVPTTNAPSTRPWIALASPAAGTADASLQPTVQILIRNRATSVSTGSIQLRFDGVNVTSLATISAGTTEGPGATVTYSPGGFLLPNSSHNVSLVFSDGSATQSNQWSFAVANLPLLPASFALSTGASASFAIQTVKAPNTFANAADNHFVDSTWRAELQLANQLFQPSTGQPFTNQAANTPTNYGFYTEPVAINYEMCSNSAGLFTGDVPFPGIPTSYSDANDSWACPNGPSHFAMAASIKLSLSSGIYRMGVRSDDGFKVTAGTNSPPNDLLLGVYDGGRGSIESTFDFIVATNGVYNFRLVYEQGGGGAECEWYWINRTTGTRELVRPLLLESSPNANGPFSAETSAQIDPGAKTITVAQSGGVRFYRLRSTTAYQLSTLTMSGNSVLLTYQ